MVDLHVKVGDKATAAITQLRTLLPLLRQTILCLARALPNAFVAERYTRHLEVVVSARTCGFESHQTHGQARLATCSLR